MGVWYWIAIIGFLLFIGFTCYACCVVSGRTDKMSEIMYEEWRAAHNQEEENK